MPIFGAFSQPPAPEPEKDSDGGEFDWDDDHGYRIDRFFELGFDLFTCLKLAMVKADWHQADKMLKQGASYEQIEQILT